MLIQTYEKRILPRRIMGVPEPCFFTTPAVLGLAAGVVMVPVLPLKGLLAISAAALGYHVWDTWRNYDDHLVLNAMAKGKEAKRRPLFGAANEKTYIDGFPWKTHVGDHALEHIGGVVSVAFEWQGLHDQFLTDSELVNELSRRVAAYKGWPEDQGFTIEHHLVREKDDSLADLYIKTGQRMFKQKGMECPPIVADIRKQVADCLRPLARTNRVYTVVSVGTAAREGLAGLFAPRSIGRKRRAKELLGQIESLLSSIQNDYSGLRLLDKEEYARLIQTVAGTKPVEIDWRYRLAEQVIVDKPVWEDGCLRRGDRYYKVMLCQNYPTLKPDWVYNFITAPVDIHVAQILEPKNTSKVLDKAKQDANYESNTVSDSKGTDQALSRIRENNEYRHFIAENDLAVLDNCYVVTFSGPNAGDLHRFGAKLKKTIEQNGGLLRDQEDVQQAMFSARLPGMGKSSPFMREDHAYTVAAMQPASTFPKGASRPESLRISNTGQLIGFAPSKLEVAHEMVVAETGGGKDSQFGIRFLETYPLIRHDIIELGNSYQGAVEAVGGHYCRAREQVINPLPSYEEYLSVKEMSGAGGYGNLDKQFIHSQAGILTPIFKGMKGQEYSRPEETVVERLLVHAYENAVPGRPAPTLPDLLQAVDLVTAESDKQRQARDQLGEELFEFLSTGAGSAFKDDDQFTISPIANAIDFDKFDGALFEYYMTFMVARLASNAMARGSRSQIVLNEYKVLLQRAADPIKWITLTIDRMGRKDWVGLTRITQGLAEIQSVDESALDAIPNKTLLSRKTGHREIGEALRVPPAAVGMWPGFVSPEIGNREGYRQALVSELDTWHSLFLKFPPLALDLMNTRGEDKPLREKAYKATRDPYERIALLKKLQKERAENEAKHHDDLLI